MNKRFQEIWFKVKREISPYISKLRFEAKLLPSFFKKKKGNYSYSVIVAVGDSEEYIDQLVVCLAGQSLDFANNIHLIFVDDRSTDRTVEKIKSWSLKYSNILCLQQQDHGVCSARNLALDHVITPWVTFLNVEDFLSRNYFKTIDDLLGKEKYSEASLVCTYPVIYNEKLKRLKRFSNNHPLKSQLKKMSYFQANSNGVVFNEVTSAFFKMDIIKESKLKFNNDLNFSFRDSFFIGDYLYSAEKVLISPHSYYFLRFGSKKDSFLNTKWNDPTKFLSEVKISHHEILKKYGVDKVPKNIQNTVLFNIAQNFLILLKSPEYLDGLSEIEKDNLERELLEVFRLIDIETIQNFNLLELDVPFRAGILGRFKHTDSSTNSVQIDYYDPFTHCVKLSYYSYFEKLDRFEVNKKDRSPLFIKRVSTNLSNRMLFHQKIIWLKLEEDESLTCFIDGENLPLVLGGKESLSFTAKVIMRYFKQFELRKGSSLYRGAWLFLDRDTQADDNAEHLYRYVKMNHSEVPSYFALRRSSHDWARLEQEGFKLIDMDSSEFEKAYRDCEKILSSHVDPYVAKFLGRNSLFGKQFIFLQHGITINNLSRWLNKKKIDCMISSSRNEYREISGDDSSYVFGKKEIVLTGFPRHDRLISESKSGKTKNTILIMPTWRMYLSGESIGKSNQRRYNKDFMKSFYAKSWMSLLNSPKLKELVEKHGYEVVFFPHANTQIYLNDFNIPSYIKTSTHEKGSIQDIFLESKIMITDYSSVAFEMGIQKKEVIYYQFDEKEFFSGAHLYKKGYFDYRKDGFGPVCTVETDVLKALSECLENKGEIRDEYLRRVENTFAFLDGKSCERVFNHILSMTVPKESFDLELALERAYFAKDKGRVELARERFHNILVSFPLNTEARKGLALCELSE